MRIYALKSSTSKGFVLNLTNQYRLRALGNDQQFIQRGIDCDIHIIRQQLTGKEQEDSFQTTLLKLFERVIDRTKKLSGHENTQRTIQKYGRCRTLLKLFIKLYYQTDDLKFNQINLQFVEDMV